MHPKYEIGATYLIFHDYFGHWKGYERIDRLDDRWLAAVRILVAVPKTSGYSLTLTEYLKSHKGVFIGQAVACAERVSYRYPANPKVEFETDSYTFATNAPFLKAANGKVRFQRIHYSACTEGHWYLAVIQKDGDIATVEGEELPRGRLIPLLDEENKPAVDFSEKLHIDVNAIGSEALITDDANASVARIRQILSSNTRRR